MDAVSQLAGRAIGPVGEAAAEETRALVDCVSTALFLALLATAALGIALAPLVVYVSAPGFAAEPGKFDLTVAMLRITFPYIVFISLVCPRARDSLNFFFSSY